METFIKNLARGAGKILREGFRKKLETKEKKGFWDLVTKYDLAVDGFVVERIRRKFPSHGILTEESGHLKKSKRFWILDPLDGTSSFSLGIPSFCTAISYVENGVIKLAAIYEPITDELFYGKHKSGAFLNGQKIDVSNKGDIFRARVIIDLWLQADAHKYFAKLLKAGIVPPFQAGSAALQCAYMAAGRYDALLQKGAYPWDYSAGALIMKEGGAKVTDFKGRPYRWDSKEILAANPKLHKVILDALWKHS